jgi:hypothetical protein
VGGQAGRAAAEDIKARVYNVYDYEKIRHITTNARILRNTANFIYKGQAGDKDTMLSDPRVIQPPSTVEVARGRDTVTPSIKQLKQVGHLAIGVGDSC